MYAVIQTGGKQYRVRPGDLLVIDKLDGAVGDSIAFDKVLLIGEGAAVTLGAPMVDGATVSATLIETRKAKKIKVFKKIRRQGYRRTRGHRQWESVLRVTALAGGGRSEDWGGAVDLTPRSMLDARARGLRNASATRADEGRPAKAPASPAPSRASPGLSAEARVGSPPAAKPSAGKRAASKKGDDRAPHQSAAAAAKRSGATKRAAPKRGQDDAAPESSAAGGKKKESVKKTAVKSKRSSAKSGKA